MHLAGSLQTVKGQRGDPSGGSMSIRENSRAQRCKAMLNPELGICLGKAKGCCERNHTPITFPRKIVGSWQLDSNT